MGGKWNREENGENRPILKAFQMTVLMKSDLPVTHSAPHWNAEQWPDESHNSQTADSFLQKIHYPGKGKHKVAQERAIQR